MAKRTQTYDIRSKNTLKSIDTLHQLVTEVTLKLYLVNYDVMNGMTRKLDRYLTNNKVTIEGWTG